MDRCRTATRDHPQYLRPRKPYTGYQENLSDLIDACGKHFARLYIIKTIWTAEGPNMEQIAIGDSPEEAVAKLWLAVNKLKESNAESSAASGMSISTKPNDGRS